MGRAQGLVQIELTRAEHLPAAEGEELVGELTGVLGGPGDLREIGAERAVRVEAAGDELRVAQDHGEHVVEVVGDAPGELPHRFHLLGLAELFLEGPALVDVLDGAGDAHDLALGIPLDRKSTRLNSSHVKISYAVFRLKKKR